MEYKKGQEVIFTTSNGDEYTAVILRPHRYTDADQENIRITERLSPSARLAIGDSGNVKRKHLKPKPNKDEQFLQSLIEGGN